MSSADPMDGVWNGRRVSFHATPNDRECKNVLVGIVEASKYVGRTERGGIPNWKLTVRGASGKTLEVDMCEQYARFS
jgi:hypothetical protein